VFTSPRLRLSALLAALPVLALAGAAVVDAPTGESTTAPAAAPASAMSMDEAIALIEVEDGVLRFDMAEDMTRFAWSERPVHDDGQPAYGNAYITQGYIYPAGTLTASNGVNPDGSPEFPDRVLGEWTCRGWHVGDGAHTETGPWVVTTQLYNFGREWGDATLITDGYSLADVDVAIERAVTGGTGRYAGARGEQRETMLGFNASNGINFRAEVRLAGR
jgi:hypothetical protein